MQNPLTDNIEWVRSNLPVVEPVIDLFGDRVEEYPAPYYSISYSTGRVAFSSSSPREVFFDIRLSYSDCKPIDSEYKGADAAKRLAMGQEFTLQAIVKLSAFLKAMIDKSGSNANPHAQFIKFDDQALTFTKFTDQAGEGPQQVWKLTASFQLRVDFEICKKCA